MLRRPTLTLFVLFAVGCGSAETTAPSSTADSEVVVTDSNEPVDTGTTGTTDSNVAVDSAVPPGDVGGSSDTPPSMTYPAGPYGVMVGNVVANLELEGYTRFSPTTGLATTATYGATSFAAIRTASPKKYALVHVSGFT